MEPVFLVQIPLAPGIREFPFRGDTRDSQDFGIALCGRPIADVRSLDAFRAARVDFETSRVRQNYLR